MGFWRDLWNSSDNYEKLFVLYLEISAKQDKIMAALDDLNASEASLETVINAVLADVQTLATELATAQAGNDDAGVEAVVTKLNALAAKAQAVLPADTSPPPAAA